MYLGGDRTIATKGVGIVRLKRARLAVEQLQLCIRSARRAPTVRVASSLSLGALSAWKKVKVIGIEIDCCHLVVS